MQLIGLWATKKSRKISKYDYATKKWIRKTSVIIAARTFLSLNRKITFRGSNRMQTFEKHPYRIQVGCDAVELWKLPKLGTLGKLGKYLE